jgi:prefoldin subunit 5
MRERLEKRLTELKAEFESGQRQLEALENQAGALRQTLLRISGAIQVLEETLAGGETADDSRAAS